MSDQADPLFGLVPNGFRVYRLEFYIIKGRPDLGIEKAEICGCIFFSLGWIGLTWLSKKYECYQGKNG